MEPITFKEVNVVYAKDQPEYQPLPVLKTSTGEILSCWKLTWKERIKILLTGRLWISLLTFNQPLQPILPMTDKPQFIFEDGTVGNKQ